MRKSYNLDYEQGLVAISGASLNISDTESFLGLLTEFSLDLRHQGWVDKINTTCLRVGQRQLLDISPEIRLLTEQGAIYMGLLPISSHYDPVNPEDPINPAALQKQTLSINETNYSVN